VPPSGSVFALGTNTVNCSATDSFGRLLQCSFTVAVVDTTPPAITCPANVTVPAAPGLCAATGVALGSPVVSDLGGVVSVTSNAPTVFPLGITVVTWTVTDVAGLTATCAQSVTVTETDLPVITSQPQSQTNQPGTTATFSVAATGCTNVTFQWCFGTNFIQHATNATLVLPSVALVDSGPYSVKVSNGAGSVTSLVAVLTVNRAPVAGDNACGTVTDRPVKLAFVKLLNNDSDPDGDPLTIIAAGPASTNGGTVLLTTTNVIYTPPAGYFGADAFNYTISDGRGGTATAQVRVTVEDGRLPGRNIIALIPQPGGAMLIRMAGIPGQAYDLQRAGEVTGPWSTVTTLIAPGDGIMEYLDSAPPVGMGFYRTLGSP
jgi:hypothetical protein